jgi:hypothetical protein
LGGSTFPLWHFAPRGSGSISVVLFIARVEGTYGVHFVRLAPMNVRFEVNARPRPAIDTLITIALPGLAGVNAAALEAWRLRHAPTNELDRRHYRPMALGDLVDAVNAELFVTTARSASADALAAFALDRGGVLLAAIRTELATAAVPGTELVARARRFAAILDITYAPAALEELAKLHPVEQLMALEHAVVQWIRATTDPPPDELAALAKDLPADRVSAGVSRAWFAWWWRLARACTRTDLGTIIDGALALARTECRQKTQLEVAREACDEADRMAARFQLATVARLWADPPRRDVDPGTIERDERDAHYAAYLALTHAAHAIAAALRETMDAGEANRHAMQLVAERALAILRDA